MVKLVDGGVDLKSKAHYKTFGKFIVNMDLLHANELLVKYANSYAPVYKVKRVRISKYFCDFLCDLLNTGKINIDLFKKLTYKDDQIFENLIIRAKLAVQLGYDKIDRKLDEEQLKLRFEILRGEIMNNNNNEELLDELIFVIHELFKLGKIAEIDRDELLKELSGLK
jgi:hypothetical protein